ncbi:hypothetical protein [Streptomyces sp. NBC_00358]|uniref:hypothetical protein n=1 Tax=Streptomyces sp. NBC_00358 TaxID=2975725 RepID=UPI002E25BF3F
MPGFALTTKGASSSGPVGSGRVDQVGSDEALTAYEHFDARDEGWTKVVLHPNGHGNGHER